MEVHDWKEITQGVTYILLATLVQTAQTAVVKWGAKIGYIAPVMLIFRGIISLICSLIESSIAINETTNKRQCNIFRILQDIPTIGIVPRRTRIPLFNDNPLGSSSLLDMSHSLLSVNSISDHEQSPVPPTPLTPAAADSNINNSDSPNFSFPTTETIQTKSGQIRVLDKSVPPLVKTPMTPLTPHAIQPLSGTPKTPRTPRMKKKKKERKSKRKKTSHGVKCRMPGSPGNLGGGGGGG
eukprot:59720_1